MPKYVKLFNSFLNFVRFAKDSMVDEYERRIVNLILENFDELKDTSFAAGKRPKLIANIILEQGKNISSEINIENQSGSIGKGTFKSLSKLEIENFRGFSEKETVLFDKRITFIYGPNGSGKSSLSEALEYRLLDYINEAIERGIDVAKYTRNAFSTRKPNVTVSGILDNGKIGEVTPDPNNDFCFIERSRIDNFARISAQSTKDKQSQLALLFGLEEFFEFHKNFSKTISDKFELEPKSKEKIAPLEAKISSRKEDIEKAKADKTLSEGALIKLSKDAGFESADLLLAHLNGTPEKAEGRLAELNRAIGEAEPKKVSIPNLENMNQTMASCLLKVNATVKIAETLYQRKNEVSFREFYIIASKLEEMSPDKCPLCETEIGKTAKHPFENAKEKLTQLSEISELEKSQDQNLVEIGNIFNLIVEILKEVQNKLKEANCEQLDNVILQVPVLKIGHSKEYLTEISNNIENISRAHEKISSSVTVLKDYNARIDTQILEKSALREESKNLTELRDNVLKVRASISTVQDNLIIWTNEITDNEELKKSVLLEVEKENAQIEIYKKWSKGYEEFHTKLGKYLENLPVEYAERLSAATTSIFNQLNEHDREYEIAHCIELPKTKDETIQISFKSDPGKKIDALLVMSEGHLKCLGLAILISKNIDENCPIVIFDDVVNAIDDDHRRGIINVLFELEPLKSKQIILSTHNELFQKDLEQKASEAKYPELIKTVTLQTSPDRRKINVGAESRHHLVKAKEYFAADRFDDCLSRCRKSLENLQSELWRKLGKKYNATISITLNGPSDHPNLKSVVASLVAKIKKVNASEFDSVAKNFEYLLQNHIWDHLNRGTHETEDKPVPDKAVVGSILKNLCEADEEIKKENGVKPKITGEADAQQTLGL
jgi:energy-coupling factor transporter ATP-binding protein EcfA2